MDPCLLIEIRRENGGGNSTDFKKRTQSITSGHTPSNRADAFCTLSSHSDFFVLRGPCAWKIPAFSGFFQKKVHFSLFPRPAGLENNFNIFDSVTRVETSEPLSPEVVLDGTGAEAKTLGRIALRTADLDDDANLTQFLLIDVHGADIAPDRHITLSDEMMAVIKKSRTNCE